LSWTEKAASDILQLTLEIVQSKQPARTFAFLHSRPPATAVLMHPTSECIAHQTAEFEHLFDFTIRKMQVTDPADCKIDESLPFCTGSRRFPKPIASVSGTPYYAQSVTAAVILQDCVFGIAPEGEVPDRSAGLLTPPCTRSDSKIEIDADAEKTPLSVDTEKLSRIDKCIAVLALFIGNPKSFAPMNSRMIAVQTVSWISSLPPRTSRRSTPKSVRWKSQRSRRLPAK
jgi:hypothetical protein